MQWSSFVGLLQKTVPFKEMRYGWNPIWQTFDVLLETGQVTVSILDMTFLLFLATIIINLIVIWRLEAKKDQSASQK